MLSAARSAEGRVAVALSGGRDSTALLHCVLSAARGTELEVFAFHVHHGLQPDADAWARHVVAQCQRWRRRIHPLLQCSVRRLNGSPQAGESIEAWARQARYQALGEMARSSGVDLVLLAHHRRDQAETVMLQAFRGGALAGVSAMPRLAKREGIAWARPWLDQPSEAIDAYVLRHRLKHISDPSNADPRFDRNRLRHAVWPALRSAFPQAEAALAASARQAQTAKALIDEVASGDLTALQRPGGEFDLTRWKELSEARRRYALQAWLKLRLGRTLSEAWLDRLLRELPELASARWPLPQFKANGAALELRAYRGMLRLEEVEVSNIEPTQRADLVEVSLPSMRPECVPLPEFGGVLRFCEVNTGGVSQGLLQGARLRLRQAGDQFQAGEGRPPRALKKQFQAAGIPERCRGLPLLVAAQELGGFLLWVPGLGVDARALTRSEQAQWVPEWVPDRRDGACRPGSAD